MMDVKQAAEYLGRTTDYVYRLVAKRAIKFHQPKPGAMIRFRREWLDDWIEEGVHEKSSTKKPKRRRRATSYVPEFDHGL